MEYLTVLYAFIGSFGFCLISNLRGISCLFASLGGALGWFVYLMLNPLHDDITQFLLATIVVAIYAEIMARSAKKPVTCYIIVSLIPMVPGGGIYYTMKYCLAGDTSAFIETGLHTLGIAGALAVGILFVSSCVRLINTIRLHRNKNCR